MYKYRYYCLIVLWFEIVGVGRLYDIFGFFFIGIVLGCVVLLACDW